MREETFSVLSLNILGIPLVTKKYRERLGLLVKETKKINPDVICFQEAWTPPTKELLIESLKRHGFKYSFFTNSWPRFNGLLTLSKYQIIETDEESVKPLLTGLNRSLTEFAGDKGYSLIRINCLGQSIFIINTHLSADFGTETKEGSWFYRAKVKETTKLADEINSLTYEKIVVAGDFNFTPDSYFYKRLLVLSGLQDTLPADKKMRTTLYNLFKFRFPQDNAKKDYIFFKNFNGNAPLESKILWNMPFEKVGYISDHAALYVKLKVFNFLQ